MPGTVSWHLTKRQFKKPLCAFTHAPLAHRISLKRAMLMQVMVLSGSAVLCFHSLWMFNEFPFLSISSENLPGCIKANDPVENALRPEKQSYQRCLNDPLATLYFFSNVSLKS